MSHSEVCFLLLVFCILNNESISWTSRRIHHWERVISRHILWLTHHLFLMTNDLFKQLPDLMRCAIGAATITIVRCRIQCLTQETVLFAWEKTHFVLWVKLLDFLVGFQINWGYREGPGTLAIVKMLELHKFFERNIHIQCGVSFIEIVEFRDIFTCLILGEMLIIWNQIRFFLVLRS